MTRIPLAATVQRCAGADPLLTRVLVTVALPALVVLVMLSTVRADALPGRTWAYDGWGTPQPVRILDSGFAVSAPIPGVTSPEAPRRVVVAVRVENPNVDRVATGINLDVRLIAGSGAVLAEMPVSVPSLLPGERRNVVARIDVVAESEDVSAADVTVGPVEGWHEASQLPRPTVQLRPPIIGDVPALGVVSIDYIGAQGLVGVLYPTAVATVSNPLDRAVPAMVLAAVAFDREDRILGGAQIERSFAPHESKLVAITMTVSGSIEQIARVEVTAAYSTTDLTPYER